MTEAQRTFLLAREAALAAYYASERARLGCNIQAAENMGEFAKRLDEIGDQIDLDIIRQCIGRRL